MAYGVTAERSLRRDQAAAVRERILAATLAVIEAGEEPTMRAVAQAAGIAERTLYRYFPAREDLYGAITPILSKRVSAPMADHVDGLEAYVERLFRAFAESAPLARALVTARWVPTRVTRPANLAALQKLLDRAFPKAPKPARESAAASLRVLYSAAAWVYLADCGFDVEESIRHVQWNTTVVLDKLRQANGGARA